MSSFISHNRGLSYILALFICLLLDIVTSGILAFIGISHLANVNQVIHLDDLLNLAMAISLCASLLCYLFASQHAFRHALLASAIISTTSIVLNVAGLLRTIIEQQLNPELLLGAAVIVYISTVLVFTVWYWIMDNHGEEKMAGGNVVPPVLVFPQNTMAFPGYEGWTPGFIDYLFLSFHTSTTVGPTETLVLSRTGKVVMMCQVSISLIVLIALATRAIGLLR
jgi:hypothetical protein